MKYLLLLISSFAFAQQTQSVDFKTVHGQITVNPKEKTVSGVVSYSFEVLKAVDTIKIDAQNMEFSEVELNQNEIQFINTKKQLLLVSNFKKGNNTIHFNYLTKPKQALYFVGSEDKDNVQIWTQGQGRYTSNWFPSFDDVNEKVIFNVEVVVDSKLSSSSKWILKE